jgi:hypothetical protein
MCKNFHIYYNIKIGLLAIGLLISTNLMSQQQDVRSRLLTPRELVNCENVTLNAIDEIAQMFSSGNLDSFNLLVNEWIKLCGLSEYAQRLIVLKTIVCNEPSIDSIKTYFRNDFDFSLRNRIYASQSVDFGYVYAQNKSYFSYVPLKHPMDSLIMQIAEEQITSKMLTDDEKLLCILFTGDVNGYDNLVRIVKERDSFIASHIRETRYNYYKNWISYSLYFGLYAPIGSNKIFSNSPTFGLTMSSPLMFDFITEVGMKIRINTNDQDFTYYALGKPNLVNSDMSVYIGGFLGYKLFENKTLTIIPKLGAGLESVNTGLSQQINNHEEEYFNVETLHLSLGISLMLPISAKNYIGIQLDYNYSPYELDKNLVTSFDNNALSCEFFFKF